MKCRVSGLSPVLLSQHLGFDRVPKKFLCTFRFVKPGFRAVVLTPPWLPEALPSKIGIYLIWGCGLSLGFFSLKLPSDSYCSQDWEPLFWAVGSRGELKAGCSPAVASVIFFPQEWGAHRLWSHKGTLPTPSDCPAVFGLG